MEKNKLNNIIVKSIAIASLLTMMTPSIITANRFTQSVTSRDPITSTTNDKVIIVLDPGHGKSSKSMSKEEKEKAGFITTSGVSWGEWMHWANDGHTGGCNGIARKRNGCSIAR